MGGDDKEANMTNTSVGRDPVQEGFDTSISRLLQDFNSAELLTNTPETSKGAEPCPNAMCDTVVHSMKHLHLRRPAVTKRKKSKTCSLTKKISSNSLNIAIAACKFQRPIVWPGRLSGHSVRLNSQILCPSRLRTKTDETSVRETRTSADSCSAGTEKPPKSQDCSMIFGKASSVDYSSLSFSGLCEQAEHNATDNGSKNVPEEACSSRSQNGAASNPGKPVCKRQINSDVLPAKFARKHTEGSSSGTNQAAYLDYRSPGFYDSCNHSTHKKSPVTSNTECTQNLTLCRNQAAVATAASSPSSLENLATLSTALTSCGQSVSQVSYSQDSSLDETNANELASYLEDLLHIPRKMSIMAEMMYA